MRGDVHTLLSLNEDSYQRSLNAGNAANKPLVLMGGDHPISWCQNWDGGKAFSHILGHARWLYYDESFMQIILGGIHTTADQAAANCSSYRETALFIAGAAGAGALDRGCGDGGGRPARGGEGALPRQALHGHARAAQRDRRARGL